MKCPCCTSEVDRIDPVLLGQYLSITPQQGTIYNLLAMQFSKPVKAEKIVAAIYAFDPNGGPLNPHSGMAVQVHRINKKLKTFGLEIRGIGGGRGESTYVLRWAGT